MRREVMATVVLLCMRLSAPPPPAAHDPTTFTVIVGENGAEPSNISGQVLFTNDSIWFRNDDSENKLIA